MDKGFIDATGRPINIYSMPQIRDVLDEARRLECLAGNGYDFVTPAVHKLDSLNSGRMDT